MTDELVIFEEQNMSALDMLRVDCLSDMGLFTQMMFKAQYKKRFIMSEHHRQIFDALQRVVDGKTKNLIINMPPRYGKTETAIKSFTGYGFALNPKCKFLHLSYSDTLVYNNSEAIKSMMVLPIYQKLFPKSKLKNPKQSPYQWHTDDGGEFYATPTQGQVTGFGAGQIDDIDYGQKILPLDDYDEDDEEDQDLIFQRFIESLADDNVEEKVGNYVFSGAILIDDPIKPEDALSDIARTRINDRFDNTIRSRVNSRNTPIIIIMQRLHQYDLCGYLLEEEPDEWEVLTLPAIVTDDECNEKPLWEFKHTLSELKKMRERNTIVFDTQMMQDPTPKEGLLYSELQEYEEMPIGKHKKLNVTDTADTGTDFLCSICYNEFEDGMYITDVVYTDKPMEVTEIEVPKMLTKVKTEQCTIESNNGGRGFSRNIKKNLILLRNLKTRIRTEHRSSNKETRIYTRSAEVQNIIYFPKDWDKKWPKFWKAVTTYRRDGKNEHDDAQDTLTTMVEHFEKNNKGKKLKRKN